jgi:hypothetical protein
MAVAHEQGDQGEEEGGKNRDPALTVKSHCHRSQPNPESRLNHLNGKGICGTTEPAESQTKA